MTEMQRIVDQLRHAHEGEAWHGPALREVLANVAPKQAATHPIAGAHSIWENVGHLITWQDVVTRRLAGETVKDIPEEKNFPPTKDASETAWAKIQEDLERSYRDLKAAIERFSEPRLNDLAAGEKYSVYDMLHGIIQHSIYHAGQIAILKKGM